MDRWSLIRDIGTWGSGLALLFWEAHLQHPSEAVLGVAVVLIAPRVYKQVKVLLPGHTGGESPPSSPPPPSRESPGPGGTGDRPAGGP